LEKIVRSISSETGAKVFLSTLTPLMLEADEHVSRSYPPTLKSTDYSGQKCAGYLLQRDEVHSNSWGASLLAETILRRLFSMPKDCMEFLHEVWGYQTEAHSSPRR